MSVMLLGVRVTAHAMINFAEHQRREATDLGAVTNPVLLDRLLDLPVGILVTDPVIWTEMAGQPLGIIERSACGQKVTRRLEPPLKITDVVVDAAAGEELPAVQAASLFAGFTRRWVAVRRSRISDMAMLEAKLCGVGVVGQHREVLLAAEKPVTPMLDGWSWLLEEKTYRRWLT